MPFSELPTGWLSWAKFLSRMNLTPVYLPSGRTSLFHARVMRPRTLRSAPWGATQLRSFNDAMRKKTGIMALRILLIFIVALFAVSAMRATASPAGESGYRVTKTIPVGGDEGWDYVTVDSAARRVYVSHGSHVVVLDADSGAVVGDVPDTPGVHGIAIAADLGRGFTRMAASTQRQFLISRLSRRLAL